MTSKKVKITLSCNKELIRIAKDRKINLSEALDIKLFDDFGFSMTVEQTRRMLKGW